MTIKILTHQRINELLNNWEIGKVKSINKVKNAGIVNHNWIIKTSFKKYVLRKTSQFKKENDIKFELKYLSYLKDKKIRYQIPTPIKTKNGNLLIKTGEGNFWLYEFIPGKQVDNYNEDKLKKVTRMLVTYHQILKKSDLDNRSKLSPMNKANVLEELKKFRKSTFLKKSKDVKDKLLLKQSSILLPILKGIDTINYAKLKKYPIHRDLNADNILWNKNNLTGIIDFDNVSNTKEPLLKDIAIILQFLCVDKNYRLIVSKARIVINEYTKYLPLPKEEISLIPDILTVAFIEDYSYAFWMLLNDPNRAKIRWLNENYNAAIWHHENNEKLSKELLK